MGIEASGAAIASASTAVVVAEYFATWLAMLNALADSARASSSQLAASAADVAFQFAPVHPAPAFAIAEAYAAASVSRVKAGSVVSAKADAAAAAGAGDIHSFIAAFAAGAKASVRVQSAASVHSANISISAFSDESCTALIEMFTIIRRTFISTSKPHLPKSVGR